MYKYTFIYTKRYAGSSFFTHQHLSNKKKQIKSFGFQYFHIFSSIRHVVLSIVTINGPVINQLLTNDSFRCITIYVKNEQKCLLPILQQQFKIL